MILEVISKLLSPLMRGSTYRRGIYLLLGGVILLPYTQLGAVFMQLLEDPQVPRAVTLVLLAVTIVIACVPAVLRGTRALEIAAVRGLLDVDLPDPAPTVDRETRLRTALWFALHMVAGGVVALGLLIALPLAFIFITQLAGIRYGPFSDYDPVLMTLVGVVMLVAVGYAVAGLGSLAALMAPVLLGPSTSERIAALETKADQLAERNRLARELHDSVGHALTVTTLQAAAAQRVLDNDPEFARKALSAIEETGRAAMEDLDHVLGLLREPGPFSRVPQRTLADLTRLVADAQTTGLVVETSVDGSLDRVSPAVSREAYRIVQESLTNVVRHANAAPVSLRLSVDGRTLTIEISNPLEGDTEKGPGGSGLNGMRDRVALLGGRFSAGPIPDGSAWRVEAQLPTGERS
ncbi:MAG TPA: two-component sensor histidine kinase [Micromonosporaceae bacterium]|nr:two-component sensor histidine kinase [Micromonosporaceae bacterium]